MKTCRKCKNTNEENARFCFQCGTRLQANFPTFKIPLPDSSLNGNKVQESFIAHPLQKKSTVLQAANQGQILKSENPAPIKPAGVPSRRLGPEIPEFKPLPPRQTETTEAKVVRAKKPLLKAEDRIILSQNKEFGLKKALQEEKLVQQKKEAQISLQVEDDLNELDRMFDPAPRFQTQETNYQKKVLARNFAEATSLEEGKKQIESEKADPVQKEDRPTVQSAQWLQSVRHQKPASPTEHLKNYRGSESSEFITPFFTLAAFLYFCYVLYI